MEKFARQREALRRDPAHLSILELVGLGGMGKTWLLNELQNIALESRDADYALWVSLAGERTTTATGPLLLIRNQVDFDCLLFDTALLAYWSAIGQPLQLERSRRLADALAVQALELTTALGGFSLPLGFGIKVFDAARRKLTHWDLYKPSEFEQIEDLQRQPKELAARLPHYLGCDLQRRLIPTDQWFYAFYDAYDHLSAATRDSEVPWLQEFIATLGRGVHVISTRDPLGWGEDEWGSVVDPMPVAELPETHSRALLQARLSDIPQEHEDRLIEVSRCVPFLLDTVANGYVRLAPRGRLIDLDDLPKSTEHALAHLLEHLPQEQREVAVALAAIQIFDAALYRHVVMDLSLKVSVLEFDRFLDWYFVEQVSSDLYKTHDLLTAFVRESAVAANTARKSLEAVTDHLLQRCREDGRRRPETVLPIFGAVIAGWRSVPSVPTRSIETLVDVAFLFYDAGYWNELASMIAEHVAEGEHPITVFASFVHALCARRIFDIEYAVQRFHELEPHSGVFGRHSHSVALEAAYVSAVAGDSVRARTDFERLVQETAHPAADERTRVRAQLNYADMSMVDGRFRSSSQLLREACESFESDPIYWGEMVRVRGHAHRFSFALQDAEQLYLEAMRVTENDQAPALLGRLRTNLAETYCWHDPERALDAADVAAEANGRLNNQTELAKNGAAKGIALAKLGRFDPAREAIADAARRAEEVGYRAGVAFALQATTVTEALAGEEDRMRSATAELDAVITEIDTYFHLMAVPHLLCGDSDGFAEVLAAHEWIDEDDIESRLSALLIP
ncbi:MAG TPA: hypothetical protein VF093_03560 [Solirubrobacterales bacterium]